MKLQTFYPFCVHEKSNKKPFISIIWVRRTSNSFVLLKVRLILWKNRRAISRVLCPQEITDVSSLKRVLIIYPHAPSLMRSIVLPSGALCSRGTKSRTGNPHSPVYMNFQPPMCTARMSPHDWWALTPPSHPYLWNCHLEIQDAPRRLFSSARLNPHGLLPIKKRSALCCPDFPPAPLTLHERQRGTRDKLLFCNKVLRL